MWDTKQVQQYQALSNKIQSPGRPCDRNLSTPDQTTFEFHMFYMHELAVCPKQIVLWYITCSAASSLRCWITLTTFNPLKPGGHYMYHQFNIQQLYLLPTQCIYVFCVDLGTNSDYFPIQH